MTFVMFGLPQAEGLPSCVCLRKYYYCLSTRSLDIVIIGRTPYHAPSTFIAPSFKASFLPNLTFAFPHLLYADVHVETN